MKKPLLLASLLMLLTLTAFGQDKRFDLKGHSILVDIGLQMVDNDWQTGSETVDMRIWGSRSVTVSYFRRINFSRLFAINPGIAIGTDKYSLDTDYAFFSANQGEATVIAPFPTPAFDEVRKSFLSATYVDIPLEVSFQSTEDKNPFRVALGGKFGLLVRSKTKQVYKLEGEDHFTTQKFIGRYGLNPIRYGLTARIGYGPVNFYGFYSLSQLFRDGQGEGFNTNPGSTFTARNFHPFSFGVTVLLGR